MSGFAENRQSGPWSLGVRAMFLPGGPEVAAYAVLPAEVRPVSLCVLEMGRFPWGPWREAEHMLSAEVVARLHATLTASYPELLPTAPFQGFDGIDVHLGVERMGAQPVDCRAFRFRMWSREFTPDVPAVQVVWDLLDPWRLAALVQ